MEELTLAEKFLMGIITIGGVVAAWTSKSSKLTARIEANEKDIRGLKEAHDEKLHSIHDDIGSLRAEVKSDVKALWDRTEERHNRLDSKIDAVLSRMPKEK
jgi:hypothetical protein